MDLELELKKTLEGKDVYVWHPKFGKKYSTGFHGRHFDASMKEGIYFGTSEGDFVFFNIENQKLVRYTCPAGCIASWQGDDEEGPFLPYFETSREEVTNCANLAERDFIIKRVEYHKRKAKQSSQPIQ